tara:strand:- start:1659 stop:5720 length:4062 start_codon:yes stop_codon:yes gene_type:complete
MRLIKFKRAIAYCTTLVAVLLALLTSYMVGGRILISVFSRDTSFFQERIVEYTGVPVSVDALTGSFDGLNPKLRVDGLRLLVGASASIQSGNDSALVFDNATIVLDVMRTILERRWILDDFAVETLEIVVEQSTDGKWRLAGFDSRGGDEFDFSELFQSLRRISYLNLSNVSIKFVTNQGATFDLVNGKAAIQNRGDSHFLHIDANLDESDNLIAFSFEVTGDELDEIDGRVHLKFPEADYSEPFIGQSVGGVNIREIQGSGSFWLDIENGQFSKGVAEIQLNRFSLAGLGLETKTFSEISGTSSVIFDNPNNEWGLSFYNINLHWDNHLLQPFSVQASYVPSESLSLRADQIDLAFISQFLSESELLSESDGKTLLGYGLKGKLENLNLLVPLQDRSDGQILLQSNIADIEIDSVRGSPAMAGLNGYIEASFDEASSVSVGFAEIESQGFSINLPNIFSNTWDYDRVNGRLNFQLDLNDGTKLDLASSVIFVESEAIDGQVIFSLKDHREAGAERDAEIELMAGATRADAASKYLYLPDGPNIKQNIRSTMDYLNEAILQGDVTRAGILYRGSTLPDAASYEKTFQSHFVLSNSEFRFSDEWPVVKEISGTVSTDDSKTNIKVDSASSLGIGILNVIGKTGKDEAGENLLQLSGDINAETSIGLNYLRNIPVNDGFTAVVSNWEAEGDFHGSLDLNVPLDLANNTAEVRVDLSLEKNSLTIPDYSLFFNNLSGPVVYDTENGLERTQLNGNLFNQETNVLLDSEGSAGRIQRIFVSAEGRASKEQLTEWPKQNSFVRSILKRFEGDLPYSADLILNQSEDQTSHSLKISSDLSGVSIDLPAPLNKSASSTMPMNIEFEFGDKQFVSGNFGNQLNFVLEMDSIIKNGIAYFGDNHINLSTLMGSDSAGITVLGNLDNVVVEDWIDLVTELSDSGSQSTGIGGNLALVDVVAEIFEVYEQELSSVNIRVQENLQDSLMVSLTSDSVQGDIIVPFGDDDYMEIKLDYLHLGAEDEGNVFSEYLEQENNETYGSSKLQTDVEEEREDPLLSIDPRLLPRLKFSTDEFSIRSRPYGSWSFSLNPNNQGASFDDLVFDFRGLRLGMDGPYVDGSEIDEYAARFAPSFTWSYDGIEHSSALTGILYADDMADVLKLNGYAASIESEDAIFFTDVTWPGSPAYFAGSRLSGEVDLDIDNGRFQQGSGGQGALRLISILNFDAIMRRARLSDDFVRTGFAYDEIEAELTLRDGQVQIEDRLVISGPSSLYQITGELDLKDETIMGEMFVTLPLSDNIPWLGLLTANLPLAVGAYLFDQIFGNQVDSLTSAVYTLNGPWEGLEPEFKQAFGSPNSSQDSVVQ